MPKLNPKQIRESVVDGYILKTSGSTVLWAPSNGVTGFTYSPTTNTFTIDRDGQSSLSTYLDEVSGLTVTGNIDIQGNLSNSTGLLTIQDDVDVVGDMTIAGDLTILGSATTINIESETVNIADNFILLNSNITGGTPDQDAGIDISRGDDPNARFLWNETADRWEIGVSGATFPIITTSTDIHLSGASFSDATNTLTLNMANDSDISVTGIVDTFITAYTYDKLTNTFTISQNESGGDLSAFINEVTGFTVTSGLSVSNSITISSNDGTTDPSIIYSGTTGGTITLQIQPDGSLVWEGDNGSLFSIVDDKSGILWAVSDVSGNDIGYIDSDWLVQFGNPFNRPFTMPYDSGAGTTDLNLNVSSFNITGNTTIASGSSLTIPSGATNGYVLTSDAIGNATWQASSSADTFTTGATLIGTTAHFDRNDSLSAFTLELSALSTTNTFVTAYTYDSTTNTFTISQNEGEGDLTTTVTTMSGLTITSGLSVSNSITISSNDGTTDPSIVYSGTTGGTITLQIQPDGSLVWEGDNGSLFSIVDDKSGILWAVSDVSGNDIGYIDSDWLVQFGNPFNRPFTMPYDSGAGTTDLNLNVSSFNITGNTTIATGSTLTLVDGAANGYILTSDSNGLGSWSPLSAATSGLTLDSLSDVDTNLPSPTTAADDGRILHYDSIISGWVSDDIVTHGTVVINARASGSTISKGTPVYLTGTFVDDVHEVGISKADDNSRMPVIGFAGEDILTTDHRHVITFGKIQGIDTTSASTISGGESWTAGDILYMSTTAGQLTTTRPTGASTQIQRVAQVLRVDASGGQLFVFNTARSAGLPNLTQNNVWVGNASNQPVETPLTSITANTFVTGFTYTPASNTFTISQNGQSDLTALINQMSGLTITSVDDNDPLTVTTTGFTNAFKVWDDGRAGVKVTGATPSFDLEVNGSFGARSKSFTIPHPTKDGKKLIHGSLEGPEHGVYYRGEINGKIIDLPDYWSGLVDESTITVQLTAIGGPQNLYVEKIENNKVYINCSGWFKKPHSYYTIYGERKDINKIKVEV